MAQKHIEEAKGLAEGQRVTEYRKPDLIPGAPAAIVEHGYRHDRVQLVTIERVLKRDVVLDNGERFYQPHLTKERASKWTRYTSYLVHPSDPVVKRILESNARRDLRSEILQILDATTKSVNDQEPGWKLRTKERMQRVIKLVETLESLD